MMPCIIHRTKGSLDLRAITVMGLSAKPGTQNPIGQFGTGLKYAIATLCRHGAAPIIWIGRERYLFSARADKFRGAEYHQVRMRREAPGLVKPAYVRLPFTTEYGKFWKPWMAFREIESNTRDEHGETFEWDHPASDYIGREGETHIIVELEEYRHAWMMKDETFLPGGSRAPAEGGPAVQALRGSSTKVYWRGLRLLDLPAKRTVRTWNFLAPLELTEDRTLKGEWSARYMLARFISESDDADLIRDVICAGDKYWEHRLDWPTYNKPSETFLRVSMEHRGSSHGAWGYSSRWHEPSSRKQPNPWAAAIKPWAFEEATDDAGPRFISDAGGRRLFQRPDDFDADEWHVLAARVMKLANGSTAPPVDPYTLDDEEIPF